MQSNIAFAAKACDKALVATKGIPPAFTKERFEWAKNKIKSEFVGIDPTIDSFFQQIESWYLFPKTRIHPTIIFLVGMTSTGKTQLVQSTIEYLQLERDFNYFHLERFASAEKDNSGWGGFNFAQALADSLTRTDSLENLSLRQILPPKNPVIMLDEFQKINTKDGSEKVERPLAQPIFEMLGNNGRLKVPNPTFSSLKDMLNYPDTYLPVPRDLRYTSDPKKLKLKEKVTAQLMAKVEDLFNRTPSQTMIDFSSSLIIIGANMDNVFTASDVTDPELLSADDLHRRTIKIRPSDIRAGLMALFRAEHVGRVGTRYIIFPSLSEASFRAYIQARLEDVKSIAKKHFRLKISYSKDFVDRLYNEGVVPTQGVRPLLQTINSFAMDPLSQVFSHLGVADPKELKQLVPVEVDIDPKSADFSLWQIKDGTYKGFEKNFMIPTEFLNSLRLRPEPARSHVAIRLAAQVTVTAEARHLLPALVRANSRNSKKDGIIQYDQHYFAEKNNNIDALFHSHLFDDVVHKIAPLVAERLIFGEASTLSQANLMAATKLALKMAKDLGMANYDLALTDIVSDDVKPDQANLVRNNTDNILRQAYKVAYDTLVKERDFFAAIGGALTNKTEINKAEIENLLSQTWTDAKVRHKIIDRSLPEAAEHTELFQSQEFLANPSQFQFHPEPNLEKGVDSITSGKMGF